MFLSVLIATLLGLTVAKPACEDGTVCGSSNNANHQCCAQCIESQIADQAMIDANPDVDWGHPLLQNCQFCAGQCWDDELDNLHCQVSQADPFGNMPQNRRRELHMQLFNVPEWDMLPQAHREKFHREVIMKRKELTLQLIREGKRTVEETCNGSHRDWLVLHIPGFGQRWHCDEACLAATEALITTGSPTPHPNAVQVTTMGPPTPPTPEPTFGSPPSPAPVTQPGGAGVTAKPIPPGGGPNSNATPRPKGNQKEGDYCGLDSNGVKKYIRCGQCTSTPKPATCSAPTMSIAPALVVALAVSTVIACAF